MPSYQSPAAKAAIRQARAWLALDPLFLDTETTGLDRAAQVVSVAVLTQSGDVLFDLHVRPTVAIDPGAEKVHGLSAELLADAPTYDQVLPGLAHTLTGRHVIAYNAAFDLRMLYQSAVGAGVETQPFELAGMHCAMELYAQFYAQKRGQGYQSQKLGAACSQCGLHRADDPNLHGARHDAELARRLIVHLAAQPLPDDPPPAGDRPGLVVIDTFSPRAGHYHGIFKRLDGIPVKSVYPSKIMVPTADGKSDAPVMIYTLDLLALTSGERERLIEYLAYQHALTPEAVALRLAAASHSILATDVRSVMIVQPAPAPAGGGT